MLTKQTLDFDTAYALAAATRDAAAADGGSPITVAVADPDGTLIVVLRMDHCSAVPVTVAINKAVTSARLGVLTSALAAQLVAEGKELAIFGDLRFTSFKGGIPVVTADGTHVGGIGVSGRLEDDDEKLANVGLATAGV